MVNDNSQEILTAIAVIQQDIKHMSKQIEEISTVVERTIRNEESVKAAHKRLEDTNAEIEKIKSGQRQVWMTLLGSILTIITGYIMILFR